MTKMTILSLALFSESPGAYESHCKVRVIYKLLANAELFSEPTKPIRKLSGDAITQSLQLDHAASKYCPIKIALFIATLMIIYSLFLASHDVLVHRSACTA